MNYQKLEDDVKLVYEFITHGNKFRCHEVARTLKDYYMIYWGYKNAVVKDGSIQYNFRFLYDLMNHGLARGNHDDVKSKIETELEKYGDKKNTGLYLHSWIEAGDTIVSCTTGIELFPNSYLHNIIVVNNKNELKDKVFHHEDGKEFSMNGNSFIYFPPLQFTKLRI
jgi:hypothetical protein